jgi:hypothetical protein
LSARAAVGLVRRWGVLPGRAPAVIGDPALAEPVAAFLERSGLAPTRAFGGDVEVSAAHGRKRGRALRFSRAGVVEKRPCDAVVVATRGAPAFELAEQAGCAVTFDAAAGFVVRAEADGRTTRAGVLAIGEAAGRSSYEDAVAQGAAAGRLAAARVGA